jgi:hypothetical protein
MGQVSAMYARLGLSDFEHVRPRLAAFLEAKRDYQTNRFEPPDDVRAMVMERWRDFSKRYGYADSER